MSLIYANLLKISKYWPGSVGWRIWTTHSHSHNYFHISLRLNCSDTRTFMFECIFFFNTLQKMSVYLVQIRIQNMIVSFQIFFISDIYIQFYAVRVEFYDYFLERVTVKIEIRIIDQTEIIINRKHKLNFDKQFHLKIFVSLQVNFHSFLCSSERI
jgi:hypothetical protein